jgi:hypothetical protein
MSRNTKTVLWFGEESRELLRVVRSREEFGRQDRAAADLETKKQAFANLFPNTTTY